jgi:glycine cleavage system H protein
MAVIEKFLGCQVEIPEDRRYYVKQGLWGRLDKGALVFGLTRPALVLLGGLKDLDWLVTDGAEVEAGEAVVFAITGKILYLDSPVAGVVGFNTGLREDASPVAADPYGEGWLFSIRPAGKPDASYQSLASPGAYIDSLRGSEGFKNPDGLKGGVSGICKAVYTGIGGQKID